MSVFWSNIVLGDAAVVIIIWGIIIYVFWKLLKQIVKSDSISFIIFCISIIILILGLIFLAIIGLIELAKLIF